MDGSNQVPANPHKIMSYVLRLRFVAVLLLLVSMHSPLFAQRLFRGASRVERQPVERQTVERQPVERQSIGRRTVERQPVVTTLDPADAKAQLQQLAGEVKSSPHKMTASDLKRCQSQILDAVNALQNRLPREFDREVANDWRTTLRLAELRTTLAQETPDSEILEAVQVALASDKEGARWVLFDPLRTALRRYQSVARMLREDSYEKQWTNVCENLVKYIETYSGGRDPGYFVALSDVVAWLDDISLFEPRAIKLAQLTRAAFAGVNVRLRIGSQFVAAGFQKEINETLDVNEMILGTKVVGDGSLVGTSDAELVDSSGRATIKVIADAVIETYTDGRQAMVTVKNHTEGTLKGEKQILFAAEGITTTPARSKANLKAEISDVKINAGPLVSRVARGQVDSRKQSSQAEAARRAERRMNGQMDERIDANIATLNARYQKIRGTADKTGLFPRVWNLSSTPELVDWSILLGNTYQPSAPLSAPETKASNGLTVQVHQSALNNMLAILLAGRYIDEEKFAERITEFLGEAPKFLERKTDETPAKVSFGQRIPIDVLFIDNKIRVVVNLNDIQVMDNAGRSFTISVEYQIKREKKEGRDIVVLEQTEAEAFPAGYRPSGGTSLSATQTIIRSYLLKRLESLPKRQEAQPLDLGGEWKGTGQLIPQFASTEGGWLTLVWSWEPAK